MSTHSRKSSVLPVKSTVRVVLSTDVQPPEGTGTATV
jgi:hypothetical protein